MSSLNNNIGAANLHTPNLAGRMTKLERFYSFSRKFIHYAGVATTSLALVDLIVPRAFSIMSVLLSTIPALAVVWISRITIGSSWHKNRITQAAQMDLTLINRSGLSEEDRLAGIKAIRAVDTDIRMVAGDRFANGLKLPQEVFERKTAVTPATPPPPKEPGGKISGAAIFSKLISAGPDRNLFGYLSLKLGRFIGHRDIIKMASKQFQDFADKLSETEDPSLFPYDYPTTRQIDNLALATITSSLRMAMHNASKKEADKGKKLAIESKYQQLIKELEQIGKAQEEDILRYSIRIRKIAERLERAAWDAPGAQKVEIAAKECDQIKGLLKKRAVGADRNTAGLSETALLVLETAQNERAEKGSGGGGGGEGAAGGGAPAEVPGKRGK